ncbi:YidC/Oxa1 family membrane protein insertase [Niallia circulans]|jgi:YidC/Oxa1 family membrane protein insertase|uniref:membrane protein insertase YidC n=1 Tax=Niallia TaxID=2837506 RepID=UPI00077C60BD|nr:membrane protein insertase YidC [Niallia circulans]MDR4315136.1 membrane protein insertase YidC [Niallia circulans]MED3839868.1 membrane protein insertase YidC [Niallia circulans]MED4241354.1 membrane protein insertase YidC [Niallia circulans]MED4248015.1 membrane protein insertase YidC [Niallia circulans]MED5099497.1 membrane protein insertase YidC [Niallia circulans]
MKILSKNTLLIMLLGLSTILLSACSSSASGNNDGFFHKIFVEPFTAIIHGTADVFAGSYGLAIILITLVIRLVLMPLMLKQYKKQQLMKSKMDTIKPEMEAIQKKIKATKDQKEQQKLQMEMMDLYKKNNINPLNIGCLPMLIQMPILMGFYYAIRGSQEIASHSFLWFNLGQSDLILTALAGIVYYLQFRVSQSTMTQEQQKQMSKIGLISPIMIVIVSLNAPAALPLYWTVGGTFLIFQSLIGRKLYPPQPNNKKIAADK